MTQDAESSRSRAESSRGNTNSDATGTVHRIAKSKVGWTFNVNILDGPASEPLGVARRTRDCGNVSRSWRYDACADSVRDN